MEDQDKWKMSFIMPSKYGSNLPLPKDSSVIIKEVPKRVIAVAAFSGLFQVKSTTGKTMESKSAASCYISAQTLTLFSLSFTQSEVVLGYIALAKHLLCSVFVLVSCRNAARKHTFLYEKNTQTLILSKCGHFLMLALLEELKLLVHFL